MLIVSRGVKKLLTEAEDPLRAAFEKHPDFRLFVTGHSLGAGSSQLVAMELLRKQKLRSSTIPQKCEIRCVALAPPPVYR